MEALGKFGLDPVLLAAQVVNFLIIAWVINRFLLKPILATMKARKEKIARGVEDAEKARLALEDAGRERDRILAEAYARSAQIVEAARAEAERVGAAAVERSREEAERLLTEGRARMELERRDMEKAVQKLSLELSGRILDSVVSRLFSGEEKARIIARGMESIRSLG
jgi:F-type H+-transporting ATPase subunit b